MSSLWQRLCHFLADDASVNKLQLETIESLLCAAFNSTHRDIVRTTAETWNRIYEDAEHIQYPETLKTVLASLGSSVDIVRPGLDIVDGNADMRLHFAESQDVNLPIISLANSTAPTPRSRSSTFRRSATPGSAKVAKTVRSNESTTPLARVKSKGRTPKTKLRHEDSQVQFEAIESSPAVVAAESQLLTERQKETRERQREQAALFPEMRSSPIAATKKAKSKAGQHELASGSPGPYRVSTPEQEGDFEDYLTSTPTPRRGQPVMLPEQDQETADPPSSPPEPRSYRLLAELKSKANKIASLDEWQFSSSPVYGSPNPALQTVSASQPIDLDDVYEELRLDEGNVVDKDDAAEDALGTRNVTMSQLVVDPEVIEETTIFDNAEEAEVSADILTELPTSQLLITPSERMTRSKAVQMTPKSDEEFVDAPTSPLPPTPNRRVTRLRSPLTGLRRSPRNKDNSQSFSVSDSFEDGMRDIGTGRIEIDIRSSPKDKDVPSYDDILPESPEQDEDQVPQRARGVGSITVEGAESKKPRRGRSANRTRQLSASKPSQKSQNSQAPPNRPSAPITLAAQESFENASPGCGIWLRKRKQSFSAQSNGKKQRRQKSLSEASQEEIPDSQPAAAVDEGMPPPF